MMWQGFGVECPPRDHETGTTFQAMLYEYCLENLSSIRWPKKYYETAMQSTEYRRHVLDVICDQFAFDYRFPTLKPEGHRKIVNNLLRDERNMRLIHPETFDGSRSIAPKASTRRKANVDGVTYVEGQRPTFKAIKVEEQAFTSKENVEKKQNHQTESKKRVRAAIKPSASDCEEVPQSAKRKREWKKKTEPEISTLPVENVPLVAVESLVDLFPPEKKTEAELRYFTITSLKINWTTENAYQYIPALHNGNSVLAPNLKQAIELAARSTSSDIVFRSFPLLGPLGRFLVLHNGEYLHPRIMEIMVSEAMKYLVAAYGPKEGASISTTPGMGYIVSYNNLLFLQELTASLRPFTLSDWDRANFVNIEAWLRNPESYLFFSSERDWKIFNIAKYNFLSNHNRSNGGVQEFNGLAEETRDGMIGDANKYVGGIDLNSSRTPDGLPSMSSDDIYRSLRHLALHRTGTDDTNLNSPSIHGQETTSTEQAVSGEGCTEISSNVCSHLNRIEEYDQSVDVDNKKDTGNTQQCVNISHNEVASISDDGHELPNYGGLYQPIPYNSRLNEYHEPNSGLDFSIEGAHPSVTFVGHLKTLDAISYDVPNRNPNSIEAIIGDYYRSTEQAANQMNSLTYSCSGFDGGEKEMSYPSMDSSVFDKPYSNSNVSAEDFFEEIKIDPSLFEQLGHKIGNTLN